MRQVQRSYVDHCRRRPIVERDSSGKKSIEAPKIEPNERIIGPAYTRESIEATTTRVAAFFYFRPPVLPLVLSGITRCAHAEDEERAREAEDEEGGQEAPETGERMQPVPPRSVSLP